jgi:hypothetical protein
MEFSGMMISYSSQIAILGSVENSCQAVIAPLQLNKYIDF